MKIRFNLLPEDQKEFLRTQKNLRTIMEQEIYMIIIFGILVISLFSIYFLLKTEAMIMEQVESGIITQSGYGEVLEIHKKFKDVHAQMDSIDALKKDEIFWSKFFSILSNEIDDSIIVGDMSVSGTHVSMKAVAQTREDVVALKSRIGSAEVNGEKCFQGISVPESDLAAPKNVAFSIGFDINLHCLQ